MRSGRMDRLVTIQSASENSNDYNDPRDVTWSNITDPKMWAEKLPQRGTEQAEAGKLTGTSVVRWRIRYRSDITADMRIRYDSDNYYIMAPPVEIGRGEGLEILTEKRR